MGRADAVDLVLDARAELGEGPVWDAARRRLVFLDIMRGQVHQFEPESGRDDVVEVGQPVGCLVAANRGDYVVAARDGFFRLDPETGRTMNVAAVEQDEPRNRMNDGACDARGRFWAGTMAMDERRGAGALYRLDPDGSVTRVFGDVTISNGIDWSPDGRLMYYVDTGEPRIDVFDFDEETGTPSHRRPLVGIPEDRGHPDGLIVDAEGFLWLALWGGSALHRYSPDGRLDRVIGMPVSHPTKCAFGGPDLRDLYVTSAWIALGAQERERHPHAGGLFRCRPGVAGRPAHRFTG